MAKVISTCNYLTQNSCLSTGNSLTDFRTEGRYFDNNTTGTSKRAAATPQVSGI